MFESQLGGVIEASGNRAASRGIEAQCDIFERWFGDRNPLPILSVAGQDTKDVIRYFVAVFSDAGVSRLGCTIISFNLLDYDESLHVRVLLANLVHFWCR